MFEMVSCPIKQGISLCLLLGPVMRLNSRLSLSLSPGLNMSSYFIWVRSLIILSFKMHMLLTMYGIWVRKPYPAGQINSD